MKRLSALCLSALLPLGAAASIVPAGVSITGALGGPYMWTYDLQLASGPDAYTGARAGTGFSSFFTIFGFAGYIDGSCSGPGGWVCTRAGPDHTFDAMLTKIAEPSVTWIYVGGPSLTGRAGDDLGLFSAKTIYGSSDSLSYAAQGANGGGNVGLTVGPAVSAQLVSEPGALGLSSIALGLLGLAVMRRSDRSRANARAAGSVVLPTV